MPTNVRQVSGWEWTGRSGRGGQAPLSPQEALSLCCGHQGPQSVFCRMTFHGGHVLREQGVSDMQGNTESEVPEKR